MHREAAALARRAGLRRGTAHAANEMGLAARSRGQLERALALHLEALAIHRQLVASRVPRTLAHVGCTQARLGQLDAAEASLREAAGRGHPELAARLDGAADGLRDRMGVQPAGAELEETELVRLAARSRLAPDAFEAALAAGRMLAPDEALRVALG